jgi:hypothetical protein
MSLKRLATFGIDEQSVEESPFNWKEMFYQQIRVPIMLSLLLLWFVYLAEIDNITVWPSVIIGLLWAYSFWPAIGAYWYWRVE